MDIVDLEARISALELVVITHLLQSGVAIPGFDPRAFAQSRRNAWTAIGEATCEGCASDSEEMKFTKAYAAAMERLGDLLVALAEPVQEAIDEVQDTFKAAPNQQSTSASSPIA